MRPLTAVSTRSSRTWMCTCCHAGSPLPHKLAQGAIHHEVACSATRTPAFTCRIAMKVLGDTYSSYSVPSPRKTRPSFDFSASSSICSFATGSAHRLRILRAIVTLRDWARGSSNRLRISVLVTFPPNSECLRMQTKAAVALLAIVAGFAPLLVFFPPVAGAWIARSLG